MFYGIQILDKTLLFLKTKCFNLDKAVNSQFNIKMV